MSRFESSVDLHNLTHFDRSHLHNDAVPGVGGDTLWASGYAAYDKLSPAFREMIDGRECVYRSAYKFLDREDPVGGPKLVERTHPMVRVSFASWNRLKMIRGTESC